MPFDSGSKYKYVVGPVEEANFRGEMYYVFHEYSGLDKDGNGVIDMVVDIGDKNLFIVGRTFSSNTDYLRLDVYASPVYTGGTPIAILPYNTISPVLPAKAVGCLNPTITDDGTKFDVFKFLGDKDGGTFRENTVLRMIPAGSTVLLRFTNEGQVVSEGVIKYLFFERSVDVPLL